MMVNVNRKYKIYVCTEEYPFGHSEDPFINSELEELEKNFEVIFISHMNRKDYKKAYRDQSGCSIKAFNIDTKLKWYDKLKYFFKYLVDKDGIEEIKLIIQSGGNVLYKIYQSVGFYALAMQNFKLMKKMNIISEKENFIYYTYWYFYYTYSMIKYKDRFPGMKVVTRAHGFDLYNERYKGARQPFKIIMNNKIDRIAFISLYGKKYYLKNYNLKDEDKYTVNRLGVQITKTKDAINIKNEGFRLVSCSSLITLKRVDLLIRALSLLNDDIEWIHFGDGEEKEYIFKLTHELLDKKKNIRYNLLGFVPNKKISEYYQFNYVDCFISTSSSEGIPVSIQEAMSFGIPIIATDVGGVSELFDNNGILLTANPEPEEVANAIHNMMNADKDVYQNWRSNSYRICTEKYNAKRNSASFVEMLKNM